MKSKCPKRDCSEKRTIGGLSKNKVGVKFWVRMAIYQRSFNTLLNQFGLLIPSLHSRSQKNLTSIPYLSQVIGDPFDYMPDDGHGQHSQNSFTSIAKESSSWHRLKSDPISMNANPSRRDPSGRDSGRSLCHTTPDSLEKL